MTGISDAFSGATNQEIIDSWLDDPWFLAIERCHRDLAALDPDYRIDQIKSKFGGLRYYFSPSDWEDNETSDQMDEAVTRAECWVAGFEAGRRYERIDGVKE